MGGRGEPGSGSGPVETQWLCDRQQGSLQVKLGRLDGTAMSGEQITLVTSAAMVNGIRNAVGHGNLASSYGFQPQAYRAVTFVVSLSLCLSSSMKKWISTARIQVAGVQYRLVTEMQP